MESSLAFETGCIYFRFIRDMVSEMKFQGYAVELWEGRGWLSKRFVVKGDQIALRTVAQTLQKIERHNRALDAVAKGS